MKETYPNALTFYSIDYDIWEGRFREELKEGEDHYMKWLLENANPIKFPGSDFMDIFHSNPLLNAGITNTLLEESQHLFSPHISGDLIFFVLNPVPFKKVIKLPFNNYLITPEIIHFTQLLDQIEDEKIFVFGVYKKTIGWFDYESVLKKRQLFKDAHDLEMKEVQKHFGRNKS